jgi:SAM-dependent methyltransferase
MPSDALDYRESSPAAASLDPIAEFYARHPYPPPVANLDRARDEWRDPNRARAEFHLLWPEKPYRPDFRILVAGCGTYQAARYALCWPEARVVGIDVSPTSITHTEKLRQQYDLNNLELRQCRIEDAASLNREFDLIVCTGVLHHLEEPAVGLRALRRVLAHDGAMHLMVYATYGRTGIYMLQEYCRRLGIGTSPDDVEALVAALQVLPPRHPLVALLRGSRDANDRDALADALLNPRERSYTVPQLFDLIDGSGLALARWHRQAPYLPWCGAIATTPHLRRLRALHEREQYVAMELWRGGISTHTVLLRRPGARSGVGFDDERWRQFVPIRLPATRLIEDRLPPGAAAVLLNHSHQFSDLIVPISAEEKRLFDAIDGRGSIAVIAERAGSADTDTPRAFFERLWRYDQVVFDISHS